MKNPYTKGDTVYLSIPMSGRTDADIREHADRLTAELKGMGLIVHDPTLAPDHKSCEKCVDYRQTIMADLRDMRRCKHIALARGWQQSLGCMVEVTAFMAWNDHGARRSTVFEEHHEYLVVGRTGYHDLRWKWENLAFVHKFDDAAKQGEGA